MKTLKSHIAHWLTALFLFPIIYQGAHVVQHKSIDCCEHHDACKIENSPSAELAFSLSALEEDCAVCDYEFSVKPLLQIPEYHLNGTIVFARITDTSPNTLPLPAPYGKAARAPPVL